VTNHLSPRTRLHHPPLPPSASVSVLADLLPHSIDMALRRRTGIYNFTNPGAVTHPQLLQLYKDIVDASVTWQARFGVMAMMIAVAMQLWRQQLSRCPCRPPPLQVNPPPLQVFSLEQQALVITAPRSNTELDCSKLLAEYPHIPDATAAITGSGSGA
jgi:hypothetical protein